ncbi:MAG: rod shape-determining protein MreC [Alphaproteobacteria bacterium]|nr:rod shape-determining protein MreC [Alphaproteobacteria bacterium]
MANTSWRIARNRAGGQLPLALLAALAIALILLGKAQSNLFDRARADVTDFAAPALQAVRAPFAGLDRWMGNIGSIFTVYRENLRLKEENARLRQWQNMAVVLSNRVQRYQLLLHAVPDPGLSSVMARVIGRSNRPFLQTMILDAGKKQGVKPGQAVIDARGMIGRIFLTGDHTSWVILLTDLNSRIPVNIEPGNVQAIMAGDNTGTPTLDLLSQNVRIKAGDQVVSSGDGGLLPPGLAIGTVIADPNGGYRIALLADPSASEDVNVVDFKKKAELPPGVTPGDLPAAAAGLPPAQPAPPPAATMTAPPGTNPAPGTVPANGAKPAPPNTAPLAAPPAPAPIKPGAFTPPGQPVLMPSPAGAHPTTVTPKPPQLDPSAADPGNE